MLTVHRAHTHYQRSYDCEQPLLNDVSTIREAKAAAIRHPITEALLSIATEESVRTSFLYEVVNVIGESSERFAYLRADLFRVKGAVERVLKARGVTVADINVGNVEVNDAEIMLEMMEEFMSKPKLSSAGTTSTPA